jgi:hypothetical protein
MVRSTTRNRLVIVAVVLAVVGGAAVAGPALAQQADDEGDDEDAADDGDDETDEDAADDEDDADEEDDEDDDEAQSQVRLLHAVPGASDVDVYVDGERVLQDISYGTATDYEALEPGTHNVVLIEASEPGRVVLEAELQTRNGGNYTVAATGQPTNGDIDATAVSLAENSTQPADDVAAVRLAHLSPDAPAVTVTLNQTGDTVFERVEPGTASSYLTIPEGTYTLDVRSGGANGQVVQSVDVDLDGGDAQTAFAIGYADPSAGNETLEVFTQTDLVGPQSVTPDIVLQSDGDTGTQPADGTDANETDVSPDANATAAGNESAP